jgi:hypothetical protein
MCENWGLDLKNTAPCELLVEKPFLVHALETKYDRNYGFRRPEKLYIELAELKT